MIVYHYTTKESLDDILKTGKIRPSNPWTTMDAAYGAGWYFTDLDPEKCDMAIVYHCWNQTGDVVLKRVEYYLKFDIEPIILTRTREHVYLVVRWDDKLIKYVEGVKNKVCSLKPCDTCEQAKKYRK